MLPTLQISDETGLLMAFWPDGTVQVPQDVDERTRCYNQLSGALALLVDTISSQTISAKAGGQGLSVTQTGPHHCGFPANGGCVPPSEQRGGTEGRFLHLVSSGWTASDHSERSPSQVPPQR